MARKEKLYLAMKANPHGDWSIREVAALCRAYDITCAAPTRGSHYTLSHPAVPGHLTVPAHRPIKPIYIRLLIAMIESLPTA
ncbi:type II toxin-antitoxin system HicA family toxin [Sphingomonas koreensis]|nr:type II toxin-antitoxin system HicA family toxin [Sphingomonas koreensis]